MTNDCEKLKGWEASQCEYWRRITQWAEGIEDDSEPDVSICLPSDPSENILLTFFELEVALKLCPGVTLEVTSKEC